MDWWQGECFTPADSKLESIPLQHCYPAHCCYFWPTEWKKKRKWTSYRQGNNKKQKKENPRDCCCFLADSTIVCNNKKRIIFSGQHTCLLGGQTTQCRHSGLFVAIFAILNLFGYGAIAWLFLWFSASITLHNLNFEINIIYIFSES